MKVVRSGWLFLLFPIATYAFAFSIPNPLPNKNDLIAIINHPNAKNSEVVYITYEQAYADELQERSEPRPIITKTNWCKN